MKNFRVTVNGNIYDVAVEELGESATTATTVAQPAVQQPIVNQTAPVATPAKPKTSAPADAVKITSPMPGTILDIKVKEGDIVSKNQVVVLLEAMKMENEIVSAVAGKVVSVNQTKGATVDTGDLILSIAE